MIEDGFYIVEVDGKPTVAERLGDEWYPTGCDYDCWQYSNPPKPVKILARIDVDKLEVIK